MMIKLKGKNLACNKQCLHANYLTSQNLEMDLWKYLLKVMKGEN